MSLTIDYASELNAAQYEAATSTEGPHLVIAGAGSGKTRVLVYRTAYLVEKGVVPEQILLLTFTRRAAREMLARASQVLDERCQGVAGGTFHSFANRVLRRYGERLGISPSFSILDQDDSEQIINVIRTQRGLNKTERKFPRKDTIQAIISKSVNKRLPPETILYEEYPHFAEWADEIFHIKTEYENAKRRMALVDYDDLLQYLRQLLDDPDLCRTLNRQYPYVMVDEYQDTNQVQGEIACMLAGERRNIMVVGDDAQSIYSFRGAHIRNILEFPGIFPETKVIKLEENYRSSQAILNLTNQVIRTAPGQIPKELFTSRGGASLPRYVEVADEHAQSRYIARRIEALIDEGVPPHEIAVLFRSGWHSNDLEIELARRGIAFMKYGGQKFVEAAHIKDLISFVAVVFNPLSEVHWRRILGLLRGIGPRTIDRILAAMREGGDLDLPVLKKNAALRDLLPLIRELHAALPPPGDLVHRLRKVYEPLLAERYDDHDKRVNDLDSLLRMAERYDTVEAFLVDLALEPPEKSQAETRRADLADHVTLSTIHSAKGLEWHTVFVIFVTEGHLPSFRSLNSRSAVEEERRLFYVAATRAKEQLVMLRPQIDRSPRHSPDRGGSMYTQISRFLIEADILNRWAEVETDYAQSSPEWYNAF